MYLIPGCVSYIRAPLLTPALLCQSQGAMVVTGVFVVLVVVPTLAIRRSQAQTLHENLQICTRQMQTTLEEKCFEGDFNRISVLLLLLLKDIYPGQ